MVKRQFKNSGEYVSLLGYGAMRFPALPDSKLIDEEKSLDLIDHAYKSGINYFDTAYFYHEQASEGFLKKALSRYPRESFFLADKMPPGEINCEEDLNRVFEEQLERCGVNYFDYYLIHFVTKRTIDRIVKHNFHGVLKRKQKEGKIRNFGFSFHDRPEFLADFVDKYEFDFAQIQLNYLDWEQQEAKKCYEVLTKRGIPVIVMEPVRGGSLVNLLPDDAVKIFKEADPNASVASWAIRFAASLPNVFCVLSGMTTMDQLVDNVNTLSDFKPLTEPEYAVIGRVLEAYRRAGAVPCTACNYCSGCPAGVDIPRVIGVYNQYKNNKSSFQFTLHNRILGEDRLADSCVACGVCSKHCPQGIDIPATMKEISGLMDAIKLEAKK